MPDDRFKRYQDAGNEFLESARTRAEEFLRELAKATEATQSKAQDQVDELVAAGRRGTDQLLDLIRGEVASQLKQVALATKAELEALERRMTGAPAKRAPAKKASASKTPAPSAATKTAATARAATKTAAGRTPAAKAPAKRATAAKTPAKTASVTTSPAPAKRVPIKKATATANKATGSAKKATGAAKKATGAAKKATGAAKSTAQGSGPAPS